jgi:hypothetical protein
MNVYGYQVCGLTEKYDLKKCSRPHLSNLPKVMNESYRKSDHMCVILNW